MNQLSINQQSRAAATIAISAARSLHPNSQALLLASLAKEHQATGKLEAEGLSRGALCKVVLAASLASMLLTSAILLDMLGSMLPGTVVHVLR